MKKILLIAIPFLITIVSMTLNTLDNSLELVSHEVTYRGLKKESKAVSSKISPITINKIKATKEQDVKKKKVVKEVVIKNTKSIKLTESNISAEKITEQETLNDYSELKNKEKTKNKVAKKVSVIEADTKSKNELKIEDPIKLYGFHKTIKIKKSYWSNSFKMKTYEKDELKIIKPQLAKNKYYEVKDTVIRKENNNNNKKETKIDRISTTQAANEKSKDSNTLLKISRTTKTVLGNQKIEKVTKSDKNQDLVFFDYSEEEVKVDNKSNIAKKITAIMGPAPKSQPKLDFNNLHGNDLKKVGYNSPKIVSNGSTNKNDYSVLKNEMSTQAKSDRVYTKEEQRNKNYNSEYSIQTYSVNNKKINDHRNFEIRFEDDIDDIRQDFGEGIINLTENLNNEMMVRRGTIFTAGHLPTTVDFVLEANEIASAIPLLTKEYMDAVVKHEQITGSGATLLVELDEQTEDLDLDVDTPYERKVFLNKKFNIVDRSDSDYSYIMILGVKPGNTIISFKTIQNEFVSKIIHLESDEVYYDSNFYIEHKKDEFELNEENLLSKSKSPLSLDSKEILGLTFDSRIKKKTINMYELPKVKYPIGTRSYIELKHLSESVFIGRWNNREVDVPSETYMRFVLDQFSVESVNSQCLIQVNLNKPAKELFFNGQSNDRAMRMQARILDHDGLFYEDLSNESKKVFILGEQQGIINLKVKYIDNSVDYIQSYCSDSTYLVEQL